VLAVFESMLIRLAVMLIAVPVCHAGPQSPSNEWLPIAPEELKMTSELKAPGAPAIILYREVDRDDSARTPREFNYLRKKVFTQEGRKYADVEIPFFEKQEEIQRIKARTIHPDGTIAVFDGKVYEKEIVKARGFKYLAKTFTLSDVQPGSIIEYQYTVEFKKGHNFNLHWILSQELFTKHAKFSLKMQFPDLILQWTWPNGLPEGSTIPTKQGDTIRLESRNIPALQIEEDMPPLNTVQFKVDFTFGVNNTGKDPDKFWQAVAKRYYEEVERFIDRRKFMEEAVAQIVSPNDTPEVKLQKIYVRVQRTRNTSYEQEKTEQERKREKDKEIMNVEDLWKQRHGNWLQLNWTFLALARAAGFQAYSVSIASRIDDFFDPKLMRASDLNGNGVLVMLNGKELYFDPGTIFTSFGLLPAGETGVKALKLDKDGGTWVTTPTPESSASQIVRKAELEMDTDGSLQGSLTMTYSGLEAAWRRYDERAEDEAHRKKFLEDEVKESIPSRIEIELTNKPDWASSAPIFVAEFHLKVPGWAAGAGRRTLLPVGLFSVPEKHKCEHSTRVYPLYFLYKLQKLDDVRIELPPGWQVSTLPQSQQNDATLAFYSLRVENDKGTLHLERLLRLDLISLEQKYYPALRNFYQAVRSGDEQQVVLGPREAAAAN
jgi:hypothetical protein